MIAVNDHGAMRARLEDFYSAYAEAIDDDIEAWPSFFTEDALYKIVAKENHVRNLPLASMLCEGRGMILDRVMGIQRTIVHFRRVMRHQITNVRVAEIDANDIRARSTFAMFDTFEAATTRLFAVGRSYDTLVEIDGVLRLRQRICVLDGDLIQGSIIYPI